MLNPHLSRLVGAQSRRVAWLLVAISLIPLGCSKEELKTAYNSAAAKTQELAAPVVEKIEEKLPETGNVALQMTPAVEIKRADVEVIPMGGNTNMVQIATYEIGKPSNAYPCMLLAGRTSASSASTLPGQSVECDMYLQNSSAGPVIMTKPGSSVTVSFGNFDAENNTVTASLEMAKLICSDGKEILIQGGEVLAVISGGGN